MVGFSLHTEPLGSNTLNHCIQLNLVLLSECGIFDAIYIEQHNQNWDIKNLFGKQNQTNLWMSTVSTAFAGTTHNRHSQMARPLQQNSAARLFLVAFRMREPGCRNREEIHAKNWQTIEDFIIWIYSMYILYIFIYILYIFIKISMGLFKVYLYIYNIYIYIYYYIYIYNYIYMCVCVPGSRFGSPPLPPQWYGTPLPPRKFPTRMLFAAFQVAASHSLAAQRRDAIAFSKATRGSRALGCPRLEPEGHRQDWHPHVTWAVGIKLHILQGDPPGAKWILWLRHIGRVPWFFATGATGHCAQPLC